MAVYTRVSIVCVIIAGRRSRDCLMPRRIFDVCPSAAREGLMVLLFHKYMSKSVRTSPWSARVKQRVLKFGTALTHSHDSRTIYIANGFHALRTGIYIYRTVMSCRPVVDAHRGALDANLLAVSYLRLFRFRVAASGHAEYVYIYKYINTQMLHSRCVVFGTYTIYYILFTAQYDDTCHAQHSCLLAENIQSIYRV